MAQLLRLKIQGVRSVGDGQDDAHIIKFLNPLTIINGPNGTGKTTTIEALNFITTGCLPSGKLPSFIHNPEIARKPRVDAAVALEFFDAKKHKCTAVKRMAAIVAKGGKLTCKSDEYTLKVQTSDGNERTISSKVSDFQRAMIQHLGVPPAILDHVIFCHQEESCWPLSEPKELKLKFDRIFQLTKFVKAMDNMKKIKKEYENELKVIVEKQKNAEDRVKLKFQYLISEKECIEKKKNAGERRTQLLEQISTSKSEMSRLSTKLNERERAERSIELKDAELRNCKEQLNMLRVMPYVGNEEQLLEEISHMKESSDFRKLDNEKRTYEKNIYDTSRNIDQSTMRKRNVEKEVSRLSALAMHQKGLQDELQSLDDVIRSDLPSSNVPTRDLIAKEISNKKREMDEQLNEAQEGADEYQEQVDNAQKNVTKLELEMRNCEREERKTQQAIEDLTSKLKSVETASGRIAGLTKEMDKVNEQLEALPEFDENRMHKVLKERANAQKILDNSLARCADAEKYAESEKKLEQKREQMEDSQKKLDELQGKHKEDWNALYGEASVPKAPWTDTVREMYEEIHSTISEVEKRLNDLQINKRRAETMLDQFKSEERKLSSEIEKTSTKIWDLCGCEPEDVIERLNDVRSMLKKARKELAPIDARSVLYDSWIEESTQKSCCPLCERKFHTKTAANDFTSKLRNMTLSIPDERDELEKTVIVREDDEQKLASCEVYAQQIEKMRAELKEASARRVKMEEECGKLTRRVGELEEDRKLVVDNRKHVVSLQNDVSLMDSLHDTCDSLQSDIAELEGLLKSKKEKKSFAELKKIASQQEDAVRELVEEGDRLQVQANNRNTLLGKLNELREKRVALGENASQVTHLQDQLKSKKTEINKIEDNFENIRCQLPAAKEKLQLAMMERTQRNDERRLLESSLTAKITDLETKLVKFDELSRKLGNMQQNDNELKFKMSEIEKLDVELSNLQKRKIALETQINDVTGSQTKLRNLEDQLTRMQIEVKIGKLTEELEKLRSSGGEKIKDIRDLFLDEKEKLESAEVEVGRLSGILEENERKLQESQRALKQKEMARAETICRDTVLDLLVYHEAVADIEKYSRCLDQSLIQFHAEKMTAINEIIDDLWRKVYKGMDIETIRIRSKTAADSGVRNKAYDYTVVMVVEGGIEVEMRGRCSAGQKMLASLLIRIALADVFGGLCSIIALDEPTTNLDTAKVDHMAEMLNELIATRRNDDEDGNTRGRQFQMVVITHDERLVDKLTLGTRPEYIYVLGKNHRGTSFIKRQFPDGRVE